MPTTPCRKIETFGRVKLRVRGKRQRIPGRHKTSAPAKTYRSWRPPVEWPVGAEEKEGGMGVRNYNRKETNIKGRHTASPRAVIPPPARKGSDGGMACRHRRKIRS